MGGRGSRFITPNRNAKRIQRDNVGQKIPDNLKDAIGKKGNAKSIKSAMTGANPNYSPTYREYSENCQRCVVAYELRRRGYDVEALPTYYGDSLPNVVKNINGVWHARWRGAFKNAITENVGERNANKTIENIENKMREYGNGSRGVVQLFWKGGGGHVFNVENVNGRIVYSDAQVGYSHSISKIMSMAKTSSVNLVRTDNLQISYRARNFVKQK